MAYQLELPRDARIHSTFHVSLLKKWVGKKYHSRALVSRTRTTTTISARTSRDLGQKELDQPKKKQKRGVGQVGGSTN